MSWGSAPGKGKAAGGGGEEDDAAMDECVPDDGRRGAMDEAIDEAMDISTDSMYSMSSWASKKA